MAESKPGMERLLTLMDSDPDAFRELIAKVSDKMLVPHSEGQKEVLLCDERFMVLCAGRRWGKSKVGAAKALREARKGNQAVWWVAPTYKVVKRGYAEVVNQIPEGLLTKPAPPDSAFDAGRAVRLTFKNGSKMEFYSAERPEGMLGGSCDFLIMDEAATMPEHVWAQIIRPTLADRRGRALFISTPRGKNWFYKLWQMGQDDLAQDYISWHFPSMTNPTIPVEEWEQVKSTSTAAVYEQEILAQFISSASSVFRVKDEAVVPMEKPEGHVILGVDWAKHNDYTVFCGVRTSDRRPCYHDRFNEVSWPQQRRLLNEAVDEILETASGITVIIDSTGVGDVMYDDLTEEGLDVVPIKFTPAWKMAAVQLLGADLERELAFIHEEQRSEFEAYTYTITEAGRWKYEAGTGHDDEVSAALLAHWGCVHAGVPDVKMLVAGGSADTGSDDSYDIDSTVEDDDELTYRPPTTRELLTNDDVWI